MSLPIWTPAALSSELRSFTGFCWRVVEAQHQISTLKLVDDLQEQQLLEEIIEETKPQFPEECAHLDYLLATPFRYGTSYPHGSRFRRAGRTPGVFYGAETVETAIQELVFYRFLFFSESPKTTPPDNATDYSAFSAALKSEGMLDLTVPPLLKDQEFWTDPVRYDACQSLADAAREGGGEVIRYQSVRRESGINLAVLGGQVFDQPAPIDRQTWRIRLTRNSAQAICEFPKQSLEYDREIFDDPRLAALP
jgi:RES domain-containing protein